MAKQNTPTPAAPAPVVPPAPAPVASSVPPQMPIAQSDTPASYPAVTSAPPLNPLSSLLGQFAGVSNGAAAAPAQIPTPPQPNPLAALLPHMAMPPNPAPAPAPVPQPLPSNDMLQQQFQLIQLLAAQGVPQDQWASALQLLSLTNANTGAAPAAIPGMPGLPMPSNYQQQMPQNQNSWSDSRHDHMRSPQGNSYRRSRSRSRSPAAWDRRRGESPPRRRDSPVYGEYRGEDRGGRAGRGGRGGYRERSPIRGGRNGRGNSPVSAEQPLPPPQQHLEYDHSIGPKNIKGKFIYRQLTQFSRRQKLTIS